ncbi:MAG TPA: hypothetical protein VLE48_14565 [Terriglobales bacterium]|nr:hypothetical protein [Terriglobales bacterium]
MSEKLSPPVPQETQWKAPLASMGALVSALLTLGCCVPVGLLGAAGAAGAAIFLGKARPWLLGLSGVFLIFGFLQVFGGARCGLKPSKANLVPLFLATAIVAVVLLFPQVVAQVLADWASGASRG